MKIIQKNDKGEDVEVEVFSPEEVTQKLKEQEDAFNAKMTAKDGEIATMTADKQKLQDQLSQIKPDHPNFAALKAALDEKDSKITAIQTEMENDKKNRKAEAIGALVIDVAKGNEDLKKKVEHHLANTLSGMPEDTVEQRQAKVEAAMKLSVDVQSQGIFDGGIGGGGQGGGNEGNGGSGPEFTPREKALGAKLGITEADYKTYGPRLTNKNKK